jgi:uncharacterized protein YbjT (DUF2867 family)
MKKILIAGASGMVGGLVMQEALNNPVVGEVSIIVRKSLGIKHDKLVEVVHSNFMDYVAIEEHFKNHDAACYCIGVYTGAVNREKFREITIDYTKAFADVLLKNSPEVKLCFLSGAGADREERSRMPFAKDKGIAENYLLKKQHDQTYIFRPGYIYPVTPRKEPNASYKVSRFLYPALKRIMPAKVVTSEVLAKAMLFTALYGNMKNTLENPDILNIDYGY